MQNAFKDISAFKCKKKLNKQNLWEIIQNFQTANSEKTVLQIKECSLINGGEIKRFSVNLKNIQWKKEKACLITLSDITENISPLLSTASHEVMTPLNGINGGIQLIEQSKGLEETQQSIEIMKCSCKLLENMIQNMRDYCMYENDKLEANNGKFNLRELMEEVTEIIKNQSKQRNARVILDFDENIPEFVCTDSKRLKQIFLNLLSISAKYIFDGTITFSATYQHPLISFEIEDTGIGLPKEEKQNLFKLFEDSPESPSGSTRRNLGLGLSISQILVKLIGTRICFSHTKESSGSQFSFEIFNILQTIQSESSMDLHNHSPRKSNFFLQKGSEMCRKIRKVKSRADFRPAADQSGNSIINNFSRQSSLSSGVDQCSLGESEPQAPGRSLSTYIIAMKNPFSIPESPSNVCNCPDALVVDDTSINLEVLQNFIKRLSLKCDVVNSK